MAKLPIKGNKMNPLAGRMPVSALPVSAPSAMPVALKKGGKVKKKTAKKKGK